MSFRDKLFESLSKSQDFKDATGKVKDYVSSPRQPKQARIGVKMSESPNVKAPTTSTPSGDSGSKLPWGDGSFYDWHEQEVLRSQAEDQARLDKEESRLKRNRLLSTIGDALGAFHDAYAKASGQQSMVDGTSLTGKWRERMDQLDRERTANRMSYSNALSQIERSKVTDRLNKTREDRLARQEERMRESAQARNEAAAARARKDETQAKLLDAAADLVMNSGMTLQDARVYVGLEPKTTYSVSNRVNSDGKGSTTVTTRTGDIPTANGAIVNANTAMGSLATQSSSSAQSSPSTPSSSSAPSSSSTTSSSSTDTDVPSGTSDTSGTSGTKKSKKRVAKKSETNGASGSTQRNNTPPSRGNRSNPDNTPPSRRK